MNTWNLYKDIRLWKSVSLLFEIRSYENKMYDS